MTKNEGRAIEILLVEDNDGDARLTREALIDGKVWNSLHRVNDGVQALAFLAGTGEYVGSPRPDLILLDLNLPGMDGREVLATVKADTALAAIPIAVLTTSNAEQEFLEAYGLNANCYIVKPFDLQQLLDVVNAIEDFWLCVVTMPRSNLAQVGA